MLGPGLIRTVPGVLRSVGSAAGEAALSLSPPAGAGVMLDREAARVLPLGRPRPRAGAIFCRRPDVGVDVSCCARKLWNGGYL